MGKRSYRRMEKKDRESRKLWAEGCREGILSPHIEPYADALARSCVAERDYIQRVQNEYHQLIPWQLPDDKEPPLPLPEYDLKIILVEDLTAEESERKSKVVACKNKACMVIYISHVSNIVDHS
jgi:hypothetical protein